MHRTDTTVAADTICDLIFVAARCSVLGYYNCCHKKHFTTFFASIPIHYVAFSFTSDSASAFFSSTTKI